MLKRLREHATSDHDGARLLRVALAAGGSSELVRLWPGTRKLERHYKQRKATSRCCARPAPPPPAGPPAGRVSCPTRSAAAPDGHVHPVRDVGPCCAACCGLDAQNAPRTLGLARAGQPRRSG